jgi:hypothetical protein
MYVISLPDCLDQQTSRAAQAQHLSVDEFVVVAVQLKLQDDPEFQFC